MTRISSKFADVDGTKTHYLEGGEGPTVILLHGADPGASGGVTWELTLEPLAQSFHVVAPDWLGFGDTDKLFDFSAPAGRRIRHMARFIETLGLKGAHMVGNSMGGGLLVQTVANDPDVFGAKTMTLISGGGVLADTEAKRTLLGYRGTIEEMRAIIAALFIDPRWSGDEAYVKRRHETSNRPGVWEVSAAMGLRNPAVAPAPAAPPAIRYGEVAVPSLLIAGEADPLRKPGYAPEIAALIPGCELHVFPGTGHFPQLERADETNAILMDFLRRH